MTRPAPILRSRPLSVGPRIPRERYTSREFAQREKEKLWPYVWLMACREAEVASPGSFYEYVIGDESIIVLRDRKGQLRAFYNVCRHRGSTLLDGKGKCSKIVCPYHMWSWNLDGTLAAIPDRDNLEAADDDDDLALKSVLVDSWGGFVFVNMDPDAIPLRDYLGPIVDELDPYLRHEWVCITNITEVMPANWKNPQDNFLEIYHFPTLHSELRIGAGFASDHGDGSEATLESLIDEGRAKIDLFGHHSREILPMGVQGTRPGMVTPGDEQIFAFLKLLYPLPEGEEEAPVPAGITPRQWLVDRLCRRYAAMPLDVSEYNESQLVDRYRYFIFPNLCITVTPDTMNVWYVRPNGDDPNSCIQQYMGLVRRVPENPGAAFHGYTGPSDMPDVPGEFYPQPREWKVEEDRKLFDGSLAAVQDYAMFARQQRGMRSRGFDGMRLMVQERRIRAVHEAIDAYLGQER